MGAPGGRDRRGPAAFWVYTTSCSGNRDQRCSLLPFGPGTGTSPSSAGRSFTGGISLRPFASGQSAKKNEGPQPLARQVQIQCLPLPRLRPHLHRLSSSRRRSLPWPSRLHLLRLGCLLRLCLQRGPQPTARWLVQLRGEGHLRPPHGQCQGKFVLRSRSRSRTPTPIQEAAALGAAGESSSREPREPAELLARRPVDPRVADRGVCHQGPRQPTGRSCWRQGARPIRRSASIGPARGHCRGSSPPALHGHLQAEPAHVYRSSVILTSCQRTCGSAPRPTGKGPVPRPQTTGTRRSTTWQTTPTGIQRTTQKICFQAEQHSGRVGYTKHRFIDIQRRPHLRPLLRKPQ